MEEYAMNEVYPNSSFPLNLARVMLMAAEENKKQYTNSVTVRCSPSTNI
jgi:hypothetical protein